MAAAQDGSGRKELLRLTNFSASTSRRPKAVSPTLSKPPDQKKKRKKWPHHPTFDLCTGPFCVKSRIDLSQPLPQSNSAFATLSTPPPIAAIMTPKRHSSKKWRRRQSSISNTPGLRECIRPCWNGIIRALGA